MKFRIFSLLGLVCLSLPGFCFGEAVIKVVSPSNEINVGETVKIDVVIESASDIKGLDIRLKYSPGVLQCNSITKGIAIKNFIEDIRKIDNGTGQLEFVGGLDARGAGMFISNGVVCSVEFRGVTPGRSDLILENNYPVLANSFSRQIDARVENISLNVRGQEEATISGQAQAGGLPIKDATVEAWQGGSLVKSTKSGADGNYNIAGLAGGVYTVRARASGYFPQLRESMDSI